MFGNKKYKKGMADAAKAYEAFGEKQAEALKHILSEVDSGKCTVEEALRKLSDIDKNINALYLHLQSKEKASLYTIYTPYDIANLDKEEKLFLGGALLRLTLDKTPNPAQQKFIRSVLKYLEIKEPPFGTDLFAIENIDSMNAQKAIYQVVLEYLSLQDGDNYDETELQQRFLESFSLNSKARATIANHVEVLFAATGADGLAEKYGYAAEDEENAEDSNKNPSEEEKQIERNAAMLVLGERMYNLRASIVLRDYLCVNGRLFGKKAATLIDKKRAIKEEPDWLPPIWSPGFFNLFLSTRTWVVSYANLCCAASKDSDKLYFIDFDEKTYRALNIDLISSSMRLVAMGNEWLVIGSESTEEITLYNLRANTSETITGRCDGAYFEDNTIYFVWDGIVHKYDLATKQLGKAYDISETEGDLKQSFSRYDGGGRLVDTLICNGNLYLLGRKDCVEAGQDTKEHYIYAINLNDPTQYKKVIGGIYGYSHALHKYDGGWIFVGEDEQHPCAPKFNLMIFSCATNEVKKLARGCGRVTEETEKKLFKTTTYSRHSALDCFKWGDYVFFEHGTSSSEAILACVNINDPMNVIMGE